MNWKLDNIAFEDYGVSVSRSRGVLDLPKINVPNHNWLDETGNEYWTDETDYRDKDRTIQLDCFIQAGDINDFSTKVNTFWGVISSPDLRELTSDYITGSIECYAKTKIRIKRRSAYHQDLQVGVFSLKLTVPGDSQFDTLNILRYYSYNTIASVKTKDLKIYKTLQGEMYASFSFNSNTKLDIRHLDFIQFEYDGNGFDRFVLFSEPEFTKLSRNKYVYKLKFNHQFNWLAVSQFLYDSEADFYFWADLDTIVDLIITNHGRTGYFGIDGKFQKGTIATTIKKNHKFSNENCLQVLRRIVEEYELEYEFVHQIPGYYYLINVAEQVGTDTSIIIQYGIGSGQYNLQRSERLEKEFLSVLFAYGAAKNLKPDYRGGLKRLSFDDNPLQKNVSLYGFVEKTVYFDEIFPQRTAAVTGYYQILFDDLTDAEKDIYPGGLYRITDSTLDFDLNDYLLGGLTAKIRMKTGSLAGYEFEISRYDNANKDIYIIPNQSELGDFPNAVLQIAIGDDYTLVDIDQPTSYITTAETLLESVAQAFLDEHSVPKFIYKCTIDPAFTLGQGIVFEVGDRVTIVDSDYNINGLFRISSLVYNDFTNEYELSFSEKLALSSRNELIERVNNLERSAEDTGTDTVESMRKDKETTEELRNTFLTPADGLLNADIICRSESLDPRMLAYDSGVPQISIKNALVECNIDGDQDRVLVEPGVLVMKNFRDNTLTRWEIEQAGSYDPTRSWDIPQTYFNLASSNGYYLYAKITMSGASTECVLEVSQTEQLVKSEEGYLKYELGFISDSGSPRFPEMIYGNIKTVTPKMISDKVGDTVNNIIETLIQECKESFLIEDTTNTTETQLSNWEVIDYNDLIGSFTATVTIYNKVGYAITTLKNVLGYDYTDPAHETEDDNEIISDGTITLVLSVDSSTDKLKAVLTGMPTDAKRITFCFEKCCFERYKSISGTSDGASTVSGILSGYVLKGELEGVSSVSGVLSGSGALVGSVNGDSDVGGVLNGSIGSISGTVNSGSTVSGVLGDSYNQLLLTFQTNSDSGDTFSPSLTVATTGLFKWDLGDGTTVYGNSVSHVYADGTTKTVKLYGHDDVTNTVASFIANDQKIIGSVDFSNDAFETLSFTFLSTNAAITSITVHSSPTVGLYYFLADSCNLTGTLDLSSYSELIDNAIITVQVNPNLTAVTMASSFDPSSGTLQMFNIGNCGITGTVDLRMFTKLKSEGGFFSVQYNSSVTNVLLPSSYTGNVAGFWAGFCNLGSNIDISNLTKLIDASILLNSNFNLTSVTLPSSYTGTLGSFSVDTCDITGTLDLSVFDAFSSDAILTFSTNSNLTGITFASSVTGVIRSLSIQETGITGTLDLSMFDSFTTSASIYIEDNSAITSIPLASSISGKFSRWQFNTMPSIPLISPTKFPTMTDRNDCLVGVQDNSWTAAEVNEFLVRIDNISSSGYTGRQITISGTNAAPDSSSGGYDGLAAKASLITKGFIVGTS